MRWLVLLVIVAAAGFFGYPLINEEAGGECDALERAAVRIAMSDDDDDKGKKDVQQQLLGQALQGVSKGELANVIVRNEYPNIPVSVACTVLYWRAIIDPKKFRKETAKLRS